jgi:hypothetical protein
MALALTSLPSDKAGRFRGSTRLMVRTSRRRCAGAARPTTRAASCSCATIRMRPAASSGTGLFTTSRRTGHFRLMALSESSLPHAPHASFEEVEAAAERHVFADTGTPAAAPPGQRWRGRWP